MSGLVTIRSSFYFTMAALLPTSRLPLWVSWSLLPLYCASSFPPSWFFLSCLFLSLFLKWHISSNTFWFLAVCLDLRRALKRWLEAPCTWLWSPHREIWMSHFIAETQKVAFLDFFFPSADPNQRVEAWQEGGRRRMCLHSVWKPSFTPPHCLLSSTLPNGPCVPWACGPWFYPLQRLRHHTEASSCVAGGGLKDQIPTCCPIVTSTS